MSRSAVPKPARRMPISQGHRLAPKSIIRQGIASLVLGLSYGGSARAAGTQFITQSMSGTLASGQTDTYGYFGPAGGDLSGLPFGATYTYNVPDFSTTSCGTDCNQSTSSSPSALVVSVTINGDTYVLPSSNASIDFVSEFAEPSVFDANNNSIALEYPTQKAHPSLQNPSSPVVGQVLTMTLTGQNLNNFESIAGTIDALSCSACQGIFFKNASGRFVNAATSSQTVATGQQIQLIGEPLDGAWADTDIAGSPIGGYTPTVFDYNSASVLPPHYKGSFALFYWRVPNDKYTVSYMNGSQFANFKVLGPTKTAIESMESPVLVYCKNQNILGPGNSVSLCPKGSPANGVTFSLRATSPLGYSGTYSVVQLLVKATITYNFDANKISVSYGPGLDGYYPGPSGPGGQQPGDVIYTDDSPAVTLCSNYRDEQVTEQFSTYFLWNPNTSAAIPVPVMSVDWAWAGSATQIGTTGRWELNPGSGMVGPSRLRARPVFPKWDTVFNGLPGGCSKNLMAERHR